MQNILFTIKNQKIGSNYTVSIVETTKQYLFSLETEIFKNIEKIELVEIDEDNETIIQEFLNVFENENIAIFDNVNNEEIILVNFKSDNITMEDYGNGYTELVQDYAKRELITIQELKDYELLSDYEIESLEEEEENE